MFAGFWRILRADLKSNKLQFGLIWSVLALSAMLLLVSLLILGSSDDPWDRNFEATNGPHLWIVSHQYDLDFSPLLEDPAVSQSLSGLMALAENPVVFGDEKQDIYLYGMDERQEVARPLLADGRWLDSAKSFELVLDFSFARFYELEVGDQISVLAAQGTQDFSVVGLAVTSHWFPFDEITKDVSPGVAYISQSSLEMVQPDPAFWYSVIGLRLDDPESSQEFGDLAQELFPGKLRTVLDWHFVRENALLASTLNGMFMGLFSVMGLIAVGMIIFNTIGGQVLSQYRNIGLLKAVGFTPTQVTSIFLFQNLVIGLTASLVGVILGLGVAPGLVSTLAENLNMPTPNIYSPGPLILVILLVEFTVGLATLLPAWQGGRINTVQAITVGYRMRHHRASRLAKLSALMRLPAVITMGIKDTFSRPMRAVLAIASLLLTVLVAMTAVGALTTAQHLANNRFYFNGTTADMKVMRNFVPANLIEEQILTNPRVIDHYEENFFWGQLPGHSDQPMGVRILSGNYGSYDFQIKEGQMISAPGEAVMGFAVLDLIDAQVGDTVEFMVEGDLIDLTVVGRHTENFNTNNVIIISQETYQQQTGKDLDPQTFNIQLKDYEAAESLRREWLDQFQGLINVSVVTDEPQTSMVQLVSLIVSLGVILMGVASANLMSNSLLSIRERVRDFGIQKAIGFTPAQIASSVVIGAVVIVLIALAIGVTLGMSLMEWFVSQVGIAIGAGPDFYLIDWGAISLLLPVLVLLAVISSLLPAMRAARLQVVAALRYE
jgi:putative ABC transport system permease protein